MSAPSEPLELPWRRLPGYHCFGCCADNPAGLALQLVEGGDGLTCTFRPDRRHESYPGVIHGGIGATVLDEVMGNALALLEKKLCFTVGMRTRFLAPLRTGHTYRAMARVVERPEQEDGLFKLEGEIQDAQGHATLMASATYQWMTQAQADAVFTPSPAHQPGFEEYFRRTP